MAFRKTNPPWTWFVPLLAWLVMVAAIMLPGAIMFSFAAIGLVGSVIAAANAMVNLMFVMTDLYGVRGVASGSDYGVAPEKYPALHGALC